MAARITFLTIAFLTVFLAQCQVAPPSNDASAPLNSERITQRYGNCRVEILSQTDTVRVSHLDSTKDGVTTTRTYAVVRFIDPGDLPSTVTPLHEQILAGASLGATLKDGGWTVTKRRHRFGEYELTGNNEVDASLAKLMRLTPPTHLATHTYQLDITDGKVVIPYATLTETHHPDYLSPGDLRRIYPQPIYDRMLSPMPPRFRPPLH
ncbi:MAG: hypothetical protein AAF591_05255 [Verrucomicrobiota bacterium]